MENPLNSSLFLDDQPFVSICQLILHFGQFLVFGKEGIHKLAEYNWGSDLPDSL